jgi:hypothetical protein
MRENIATLEPAINEFLGATSLKAGACATGWLAMDCVIFYLFP